MDKRITITAAILILTAIILGAMAAHFLKERVQLPEAGLNTFEKAIRYQMYMGLGMLIVGLNANKIKLSLGIFYYLGLIGVILFSGMLYIWSFHEIAPIPKLVVYIVPFGGVSMILSWLLFLVKVFKNPH